MDYSHYTKSELIDMLVELKWDLEHLQATGGCTAEPGGWSSHYALFPQFINDQSKNLVLVNTSYRICYVNESALNLLGIRKPEIIRDRNIFDFIGRPAAQKLKNLIDQTYFSGKKEQ